jgi:oxysterol-binding protein-related protein 8
LPLSDGDTSQKQIEQILAVIPILRGQKSNEKNVIPPRGSTERARPEEAHLQQPTQPQRSQIPSDDLIDFGQNDSSHSANTTSHNPPMPRQPSDLQAAQTKNGDQSQKELEQTLASTSTEVAQGPLIDFHDDMHNSLPPKQELKRQDTSDDEFVDAEG